MNQVPVHRKNNPYTSVSYKPEYHTEIPKQEFNLILRSYDVASVSGNSPVHSVFPVKLPKFTSKLCRVILRSIVFDNSQGTNAANQAVGIHIKEFLNVNSYVSTKNGPDDLLFQVQSYNYQNFAPDRSGVIIESSRLSNTQLTVYFQNQVGPSTIQNIDGTYSTNGLPSDNWSMDLLLLEL